MPCAKALSVQVEPLKRASAFFCIPKIDIENFFLAVAAQNIKNILFLQTDARAVGFNLKQSALEHARQLMLVLSLTLVVFK